MKFMILVVANDTAENSREKLALSLPFSAREIDFRWLNLFLATNKSMYGNQPDPCYACFSRGVVSRDYYYARAPSKHLEPKFMIGESAFYEVNGQIFSNYGPEATCPCVMNDK